VFFTQHIENKEAGTMMHGVLEAGTSVYEVETVTLVSA